MGDSEFTRRINHGVVSIGPTEEIELMGDYRSIAGGWWFERAALVNEDGTEFLTVYAYRVGGDRKVRVLLTESATLRATYGVHEVDVDGEDVYGWYIHEWHLEPTQERLKTDREVSHQLEMARERAVEDLCKFGLEVVDDWSIVVGRRSISRQEAEEWLAPHVEWATRNLLAGIPDPWRGLPGQRIGAIPPGATWLRVSAS